MAADAGPQDGAAGRTAGARWLVDGMNLMGSRPYRWWNDPDGAVRRLVQELNRHAAAIGEDVTVVSTGGSGRLARRVARPWCGAPGRKVADNEMICVLANDEASHTCRVVTSDKRLAERARQLGARATSSAGSCAGVDAGTLTDGTWPVFRASDHAGPRLWWLAWKGTGKWVAIPLRRASIDARHALDVVPHLSSQMHQAGPRKPRAGPSCRRRAASGMGQHWIQNPCTCR